ncbi:MAG TPA: peptide chain release factor N(5)-glutamine methyltransferase [Coleofasciculaceae cyanobacterium]
MTHAPHLISGQSLWEWRQDCKKQAIAADIPEQEVDWLLQELAGLDRLALRLETFRSRPEIRLPISFTELQSRWQRRVHQRVPVQYLAGFTPWRQLRLKVSEAVLIPRPETETLIDLAIAAVPSGSLLTRGHWADLGTGSGAISLGLAQVFPEATIHGVDTSSAALEIARANVAAYGLESVIHLYQGFWLEPLTHLKGQLSGIISNPPYIPSQQLPFLQPEVTRHEPHLALDGGPDGLTCIRHLVRSAAEYLQPGGLLLLEMMAGQRAAVADLLTQTGAYHSIKIDLDLAGLDRYALAYKI